MPPIETYMIDPSDESRKKFLDNLPQKLEDFRLRIVKLENLLKDIGKEVDADVLFLAVATELCSAPAGLMTEAEHGTFPHKIALLTYHLFSNFGNRQPSPDPRHISLCINVLDELVELSIFIELNKGFNSANNDQRKEFCHFFQMQNSIVHGSAYPLQTKEEIDKIQGKFDSWFASRTGIAPTRATEICFAIVRTLETRLTALLPEQYQKAREYQKLWNDLSKLSSEKRTENEKQFLGMLSTKESAFAYGSSLKLIEKAKSLAIRPSDLTTISPSVTALEWDSFIKLLGLTPAIFLKVKNAYDLKKYPVFIMPKNSVFISEISNTLDVLQSRYWQSAESDSKFYQRFQKHQANWVERKAIEYLRRLFPSTSIFSNLEYPNPEKSGIAQLDALIIYGPLILIIEVKSKQFRGLTDPENMRAFGRDLHANIEEPFNQALRAIQYLNSSSEVTFTEKISGKKAIIRKEEIQRVYPITVSQHYLGGAENCVRELQKIGLLKKYQFPFSICLSDLDVVSQFCGLPEVFLHYIEQRLHFAETNIRTDGRTLDLFGAYLACRLLPHELFKNNEKPSSINFCKFSQVFDDWNAWVMGDRDDKPEIHLEIPKNISKILEELSQRSDHDSIWIAFSLLTLSTESLTWLDESIDGLRKNPYVKAHFRWKRHVEGGTSITLIYTAKRSIQDLQERVKILTEVHKYQSKANRAIGLALHISDGERPFHSAFWVESEWSYSEEIEKLAAAQPAPQLPPGFNPPGRNEPCFCGSGLKFKKCCLPRLK
jgi:hypothetical protein